MKLPAEDYRWINEQLKGYKIRYQEIHDELFDHIVSDIEQHRAEGNPASLESLFQHIIFQFGGKDGIESIAKSQEFAYRKRISVLFWKIYGSYLDWKAIAFIILSCGICLYLPPVPLISQTLMVALYIISVIPIIYAFGKMKAVKVTKGKQSMVTRYIVANSMLPTCIMSLFLNLPNAIDDILEKSNHVRPFINSHPVIPAFLLTWFIIYMASYFKLSRQELATREAL